MQVICPIYIQWPTKYIVSHHALLKRKHRNDNNQSPLMSWNSQLATRWAQLWFISHSTFWETINPQSSTVSHFENSCQNTKTTIKLKTMNALHVKSKIQFQIKIYEIFMQLHLFSSIRHMKLNWKNNGETNYLYVYNPIQSN
jgi:hypothetical protein